MAATAATKAVPFTAASAAPQVIDDSDEEEYSSDSSASSSSSSDSDTDTDEDAFLVHHSSAAAAVAATATAAAPAAAAAVAPAAPFHATASTEPPVDDETAPLEVDSSPPSVELARDPAWEAHRTSALPLTAVNQLRMAESRPSVDSPISQHHHLADAERRATLEAVATNAAEHSPPTAPTETQAVAASQSVDESAEPPHPATDRVDNIAQNSTAASTAPSAAVAAILATLPPDATLCTRCVPAAPCHLLTLDSYTQVVTLSTSSLTATQFQLPFYNPNSEAVAVKLTSNAEAKQHIFFRPQACFYVDAYSSFSFDVDYVGEFQSQCRQLNTNDAAVASPHIITVAMKILRPSEIPRGRAPPTVFDNDADEDATTHSFSFRILWRRDPNEVTPTSTPPPFADSPSLAMKGSPHVMFAVTPYVEPAAETEAPTMSPFNPAFFLPPDEDEHPPLGLDETAAKMTESVSLSPPPSDVPVVVTSHADMLAASATAPTKRVRSVKCKTAVNLKDMRAALAETLGITEGLPSPPAPTAATVSQEPLPTMLLDLPTIAQPTPVDLTVEPDFNRAARRRTMRRTMRFADEEDSTQADAIQPTAASAVLDRIETELRKTAAQPAASTASAPANDQAQTSDEYAEDKFIEEPTVPIAQLVTHVLPTAAEAAFAAQLDELATKYQSLLTSHEALQAENTELVAKNHEANAAFEKAQQEVMRLEYEVAASSDHSTNSADAVRIQTLIGQVSSSQTTVAALEARVAELTDLLTQAQHSQQVLSAKYDSLRTAHDALKVKQATSPSASQVSPATRQRHPTSHSMEAAAEEAKYVDDVSELADPASQPPAPLSAASVESMLREWESTLVNAEERRQEEADRIREMQATNAATPSHIRTIFDTSPKAAELYHSQVQYLTGELIALDGERDTLMALELGVKQQLMHHHSSAALSPEHPSYTERRALERTHFRLRERAIRNDLRRAQHRVLLSAELEQAHARQSTPPQSSSMSSLHYHAGTSMRPSTSSISPPRKSLSPSRAFFPSASMSELRRPLTSSSSASSFGSSLRSPLRSATRGFSATSPVASTTTTSGQVRTAPPVLSPKDKRLASIYHVTGDMFVPTKIPKSHKHPHLHPAHVPAYRRYAQQQQQHSPQANGHHTPTRSASLASLTSPTANGVSPHSSRPLNPYARLPPSASASPLSPPMAHAHEDNATNGQLDEEEAYVAALPTLSYTPEVSSSKATSARVRSTGDEDYAAEAFD